MAAATLMHDVLAARPWVTEILTADDLLGDSALWLVEAIVAGANDAGADPEAAVHLYRHIWYFTAGEILVRARRTRRHVALDRPTYREQAFAELDPATYPRLSGLGSRWADLHGAGHLRARPARPRRRRPPGVTQAASESARPSESTRPASRSSAWVMCSRVSRSAVSSSPASIASRMRSCSLASLANCSGVICCA